MNSPFERSVEVSIYAAVDFLLEQQDEDGFWREFDLQPGTSEAWTTAWVGWCLTRAAGYSCAREFAIRNACRRAAWALWRSRCDGGWGYNRRTGPDADTTAWVLRFLSACGFHLEPTAYLAPYVDPGGGVHTFLEPDYGAWTDAHDDVAANAGLALLATPASRLLATRIGNRLENRFPWRTFWWSTPTYGVAWTIRFLAAVGSLSRHICDPAQNWIAGLPEANSGFEVAHRLMAFAQTGGCRQAQVELVSRLLDLAGPHGWPCSAHLLVPPRDAGPEPPSNPELKGLLTTSICVQVLAEWFRNQH